MSHAHLKILSIIEDTQNSNGNVTPRLRVKFEFYKPVQGYANLKDNSSEFINTLKALQGGDAMVPLDFGLMNGKIWYKIPENEDIIPLHQPEKVTVSRIVELEPVKPETKPDLKTLMANR